VEIRVATDEDWRSGCEVIGAVPEAFDHPDHGLVGLHMMDRRL
jgi:hypothetical protein